MKFVHSPQNLNKYLDKYHIRSYFDTPDIEFQLLQMEKGEIIPRPVEYLYFLVKGKLSVYAIMDDGTYSYIKTGTPGIVVGDTEIVGRSIESNCMEAASTALLVVVSLTRYKSVLMDDNRFLRFILHSITQKLFLFSPDKTNSGDAEQRFYHYIGAYYRDKPITHIIDISRELHISERHIQRILKSALEKGFLTRTGKGVYHLTDAFPITETHSLY